MNNILDNLFYKEKLETGNKLNKTTFIQNVRKTHPEVKLKDIQEYIKNIKNVRETHPEIN